MLSQNINIDVIMLYYNNKFAGSYTIEAGGSRKTGSQSAEVDNAFVVKDDIVYGLGKTIPLWLFGFLY